MRTYVVEGPDFIVSPPYDEQRRIRRRYILDDIVTCAGDVFDASNLKPDLWPKPLPFSEELFH